MAFVVDASMVLSWHFVDERTPEAMAVFDRTVFEPIIVPAHWGAEIVNGALTGERRGRASVAQTGSLVERIGSMMIEVDQAGEEDVLFRIVPIARAHRLSVYDAIYLELAERRGLPLATLDGPLAAAARSVGIMVLGKGS